MDHPSHFRDTWDATSAHNPTAAVTTIPVDEAAAPPTLESLRSRQRRELNVFWMYWLIVLIIYIYCFYKYPRNIPNPKTSNLQDRGVRTNVYAHEMVEREIQKHLTDFKDAVDGLGRPDYALASAGASVIRHSAPYLSEEDQTVFEKNISSHHHVHTNALKMLSPSFGEPGHCFPLRGTCGSVDIRLRAPILPEAITLEHVAKSVEYDRSSAPKECRVLGWFQGEDTKSGGETKKMVFLTKMIYDINMTNNVQTFDVVGMARLQVVDTIRLIFTSNHGNPSHTCIYRLRVHGQPPEAPAAAVTVASI